MDGKMSLNTYFENIKNDLSGDHCWNDISSLIGNKISEDTSFEILTRFSGRREGNLSYQLDLKIFVGRNLTRELLKINVDFEEKKIGDILNYSFKKIELRKNKFNLNTFGDLKNFCKELKNFYSSKYASQINEYLELANNLNISKDDAIKLGIAFYKLSQDAKNILIENKKEL